MRAVNAKGISHKCCLFGTVHSVDLLHMLACLSCILEQRSNKPHLLVFVPAAYLGVRALMVKAAVLVNPGVSALMVLDKVDVLFQRPIHVQRACS